MNNKNNKNLWIVLGLVALVIIIWAVVMSSNSYNQPSSNTTYNMPAPAPSPVATAPSSSSAAYTAALLKYGTNRIQFQQACQTVPNAMVVKSGTTIMLDNRASITHTVKLDRTYVIRADGFTTTTLSGGTLPRKILVDCDKSQNVATITVEK
jgi:hypothetical protein